MNLSKTCIIFNIESVIILINEQRNFLKINSFFGSPDHGALKAACPDPRMSFSGIPNSQHCGGLLAFDMIAAVALLAFSVQSEKKCFVLHLKELLHKKILKHAKLALQRANNPVVNETNCSETLDN